MHVDLRFVPAAPDVPAFTDLLIEYYDEVLERLRAVGGPDLSGREFARETVAHLDGLLPPDNRLLLGWDTQGQLVACGSLRRIRRDAVETKRMFVRPEARGRGLGRRLFEMRIAEARKMGCRAIYADAVKGNRAMLDIYEHFGFAYVPRYTENANPADFEPFLVFLECRLN